jgi:CRISPR system Cascade subunit CasD
LTDAVFVAAVSGDGDLLEGLEEALRHPVFPLYLGRRSCVPVGPVTQGLRSCSLWDALSSEPWSAARWWRRRQGKRVSLELRIDSEAVPEGASVHSWTQAKDAPRSFDPTFRDWALRSIAHGQVVVDNPDARSLRFEQHDPMAALGGA